MRADSRGRRLKLDRARARIALEGQTLPAMTSYAQNFEDVMIRRALQDIATGFYIDIGAFHPSDDSVTRWFYDQGWTGVNVEPNPALFARFPDARPRDVNLACAVSSAEGTVELNIIGDTGLSTLSTENVAIAERSGYPVSERVVVPSRSLESILAEFGTGREVDFLKIDAEGAEPEIIHSGEFNAVRPRLLIVECIKPFSADTTWDEWEPYLAARRYSFVWFDGVNAFYLREEDAWRAQFFFIPPSALDNFTLHYHGASLARIAELEAQRDDGLRQLAERDASLVTLESDRQRADDELALSEAARAELETRIGGAEYVIGQKNAHIAELDAQIATLGVTVQERDLLIADRDARITYAEQRITERDAAISERDARILERDAMIAERDGRICERDDRLAVFNAVISERDAMVAERDLRIAERDAMIVERDQRVLERDRWLTDRDARIVSKEQELTAVGTERDRLRNEKHELETRIAELEAVYRKTAEAVEFWRSAAEAHLRSVEAARERVSELEAQFLQTAADRDYQTEERRALAEVLAGVSRLSDERATRIGEVEAELLRIESLVGDLSLQLADRTERLELESMAREAEAAAREQLAAELLDLNHAYGSQAETIRVMRGIIDDLREKVSSDERLLDSLTRQNADLTADRDALRAELDRAAVSVAVNEAALAQVESQQARLAADNRQMSQRVAGLEQQLEERERSVLLLELQVDAERIRRLIRYERLNA